MIMKNDFVFLSLFSFKYIEHPQFFSTLSVDFVLGVKLVEKGFHLNVKLLLFIICQLIKFQWLRYGIELRIICQSLLLKLIFFLDESRLLELFLEAIIKARFVLWKTSDFVFQILHELLKAALVVTIAFLNAEFFANSEDDLLTTYMQQLLHCIDWNQIMDLLGSFNLESRHSACFNISLTDN